MKYIKDIISNILSAMFPHVEPIPHLTPFIQETWLEKNMHETHIIDYLWTPSKEN